jgi:hypothetical protein
MRAAAICSTSDGFSRKHSIHFYTTQRSCRQRSGSLPARASGRRTSSMKRARLGSRAGGACATTMWPSSESPYVVRIWCARCRYNTATRGGGKGPTLRSDSSTMRTTLSPLRNGRSVRERARACTVDAPEPGHRAAAGGGSDTENRLLCAGQRAELSPRGDEGQLLGSHPRVRVLHELPLQRFQLTPGLPHLRAPSYARVSRRKASATQEAACPQYRRSVHNRLHGRAVLKEQLRGLPDLRQEHLRGRAGA